jgi:hypothetical protein
MIALRTRILLGLLVLLAAAPEARPQMAQGGRPTRQAALRKTGKLGKNGSSSAPAAMPALCFQPGIGWQSIHPEPPGGPTTPGASGSIGLEVSRSTSAANGQSIYARSSSARQVYTAECAGNSIKKKALGADVEKLTILNRPQTKPGTVPSLHVNSPDHDLPDHAHGNANLEPVRRMSSVLPPAPTYFASDAEPDLRSDQVGVHAFHAYLSSIKLRRLIRDQPDFRTRLKLQQLQSAPATQQHKATGFTKTGVAAAKPLQGERANRTSSRKTDTHDRARHNSPALLSGSYR